MIQMYLVAFQTLWSKREVGDFWLQLITVALVGSDRQQIPGSTQEYFNNAIIADFCI